MLLHDRIEPDGLGPDPPPGRRPATTATLLEDGPEEPRHRRGARLAARFAGAPEEQAEAGDGAVLLDDCISLALGAGCAGFTSGALASAAGLGTAGSLAVAGAATVGQLGFDRHTLREFVLRPVAGRRTVMETVRTIGFLTTRLLVAVPRSAVAAQVVTVAIYAPEIAEAGRVAAATDNEGALEARRAFASDYDQETGRLRTRLAAVDGLSDASLARAAGGDAADDPVARIDAAILALRGRIAGLLAERDLARSDRRAEEAGLVLREGNTGLPGCAAACLEAAERERAADEAIARLEGEIGALEGDRARVLSERSAAADSGREGRVLAVGERDRLAREIRAREDGRGEAIEAFDASLGRDGFAEPVRGLATDLHRLDGVVARLGGSASVFHVCLMLWLLSLELSVPLNAAMRSRTPYEIRAARDRQINEINARDTVNSLDEAFRSQAPTGGV